MFMDIVQNVVIWEQAESEEWVALLFVILVTSGTHQEKSITGKLAFERALINIEEICMMYDPNGNSQALEAISEICETVFEGRRR